MLLWDEGKDAEHRKLTRRMRVSNPIPSQYGTWDTGTVTKNIRLDRIIEDPVCNKSEQSYFIQLVDFCAYSLLRRERPLQSKSKYGLDQAFQHIQPVLFTKASNKGSGGYRARKAPPQRFGRSLEAGAYLRLQGRVQSCISESIRGR
jgi:hypothetical protein